MTIDPADLARLPGPRYRALAEAIAAAVRGGRLEAGARLPTQRALAHRLGVTVGTVGRAYELAERQGWIRCEVGRGSFVQAPERSLARLLPANSDGDNTLDLRINGPSPTALDEALAESLRALMAEPIGRVMLRRYAPGAGLPAHRAAAAAWLRDLGVPAEPGRVLLTGGAQAGLHLALAALARPGDTLLVEELAYPGLRDLAEILHLRPEPVAIDADGMRADALADAVATSGARLAVVVPDLHNPTTATMPTARREALVEVAERTGLLLIEDSVYRPLTGATLPALAALAPARTIHVASLSKAILPGLRIGVLAAPPGLVPALTQVAHATRIGESPLLAELLARWLASGQLHAAAAAQRACADERQARARARLPDQALRTAPGALHAWLELPAGWTGAEAARRLEAQALLVAPADLFSFTRQPAPAALRLALGWPRELAELDRALDILAGTLTDGPAQRAVVV